MYDKGSVGTGLDVGEAFLHMRRAQWGCGYIVHSMQEVETCHDHRWVNT